MKKCIVKYWCGSYSEKDSAKSIEYKSLKDAKQAIADYHKMYKDSYGFAFYAELAKQI